MKETNIQEQIVKYLKKTFPGCLVIHFSDNTTPNILDLYFAYQGVSIWFEVKSPTGTLRLGQAYMLKRLSINKIPSGEVRSVEDVQKIIAKTQLLR